MRFITFDVHPRLRGWPDRYRRPRRHGRIVPFLLILGAAVWALFAQPASGLNPAVIALTPTVSCTVSAGVTISGTTITGTNGGDTIDCSSSTSDLTIYGLGGNDRIKGGSGNDTIYGGAGNDLELRGGDGNDQIFGEGGNDNIYGDGGDDTIDGGTGNNDIWGGDGNDTITGGDGNDNIRGEAGNDTIFGRGGNDRISGGDGDDILHGEGGADDLDGGPGDDCLTGGDGIDTLTGGDGNDSLSGGNANDTLYGGDGNDQLKGGAGNDSLYGQGGSDVFDSGDDASERKDFNSAQDSVGNVTIPCESGAVCGNGTPELGEQCDLGSNNGQPGFCCTSTCQYANSNTLCRPAAGQCDVAEYCTGSDAVCPSDEFQPNGTLCNADNNGCTQNDSCQNGVCIAGSPPNCDDDKPCTTDTCQSTGPNSYTCQYSIQSGNCLINGTCYTSGQNNPNNECQACRPDQSQTSFTNKANGTACTDDGKACTDDVCQAGTCTHPIKPMGTPCHPGDNCPAEEQCTGLSPDCPRPDADQDGTRDKCDFCPTTPTGTCSNMVAVAAMTFTLTGASGPAVSASEEVVQVVNSGGALVADFAMNQVMIYLSKGDGTFQRFRTYMTGNGPIAIGIGDFNGDGRTDWVTANNLDSTLTVGLGRGDGTFDRIFPIFLIGGVNPSALTVADFDRDGRPDIAVSNFTSNNITVLLGRGDGRFVEAFNIPLFGNGPSAIVVADFNLDGVVDLAVSYMLSNEVALLLGNGQGGFREARRLPVREGPVALVASDFNQDGRPDLAVANFTADTVSLLLSQDRPLNFTRMDVSVGSNPIALVTGEFVPGTLSVAAANFTTSDISLVPASLQSPLRVSRVRAVTAPTSLDVGDFNNDGKLDIVIVGSPFGQLVTLLGAGDGTFIFKR